MTGIQTTDSDKSPQVIIVETTKTNDGSMSDVSAVGSKSTKTKKRLIAAVSCIVVTVIIVVAVLIGVKFFLDSTNDIVKRTLEFKTNEGQKLNQNMTSYASENVVEYHRLDNDYEVWVIEDYNRDIKVMKTRTRNGQLCFVTPLNESENSAEALRNVTSPTGPVPTVNSHYTMSQRPIKDKSVLGPNGAELCSSDDVYWITPQCDDNNNSRLRRSAVEGARRIVRRYIVNHYICYLRYVFGNTAYYDCYYIGSSLSSAA
jgi:hypothetical protein